MPTALVTAIDGYGQLGTRVWESLAAAPAPRLGAFIAVDDGTTGRLYFGASLAGAATWVDMARLLETIQTVATPTNNSITSTDDTATGLGISTSGPALTAESPLVAALFAQPDGSAGLPVVQVHRASGTPGTPLIEVEESTLTGGPLVNGSGETCVSFYSALPAASVYHRGAIIRVSPGAPTADTFYLGGLDASGADVWLDFTGAAGPPGVTPEFRVSGGYIQVSYDSGATWTNLVALSAITGPAGPTGPAGVWPDYPALPATDGIVTFRTIVGAAADFNFWLPWKVPAGYGIRVVRAQGLWSASDTGTGDTWIDDATGDSGVLVLGYNRNRLLIEPHTAEGGVGGTLGDVLAGVVTNASDAWWLLFQNTPAGYIAAGFIVADVEVRGNAYTSPAWHAHIDFTASDGGFAAATESSGHTGDWVSGTGWVSAEFTSGNNYIGVYISLAIDSTTISRMAVNGSLVAGTFPGGDFQAGIYIDANYNADLGTFATGSYFRDTSTAPFLHNNISFNVVGATSIAFWLYASEVSGTPTGSSVLTSVDIYGPAGSTPPSQLVPYLV